MTSTDRSNSMPRSVLILGGTSDIGVAIAEALVREQSGPVVIAARDEQRAEPVADRLRKAGATDAHFLPFDGGEVHRARPAVAEAAAILGTIDVAIVAFGVFASSENLRDDLPAALRLVEVNLMGGIAAGEALAAQLQLQRSGTIVAVSSRGTEYSPGGIKVYKASKAGFDIYFQGLGAELAQVGASVLVVRPPGVNTALVARQENFLEPSDVAAEVMAALANGSSELTILSKVERRLQSRSLLRKVRDRFVFDLKRVFRRLR
jgi:decaprenylphospho-beta-D-erythro-pentofuranosid-2-ulose 2-reductase